MPKEAAKQAETTRPLRRSSAETRTTTSAASRSSTCPTPTQLAKYTETVNANNRLAYSLAGLEKPRPDAQPVPVPERHGEPSVFKHVIYVIKENRTYDQVFGDMKEGNGDPNLCMFGEEVTPNHHKLAREFTLFDNFYCSGVLSADGHQWVNEAYVTDYLEKAFGGFTRSYPYEGSDPLAFASSGFLWDNALARKKTFRNYGEFVKSAAPQGRHLDRHVRRLQERRRQGQGRGQGRTCQSLEPYTHPGYPGFPLSIPDVYRAKLFIDELKAYEQKGEFPNLIYLFLPCDHTSGTRPGIADAAGDGGRQRPGAGPGRRGGQQEQVLDEDVHLRRRGRPAERLRPRRRPPHGRAGRSAPTRSASSWTRPATTRPAWSRPSS